MKLLNNPTKITYTDNDGHEIENCRDVGISCDGTRLQITAKKEYKNIF